MVGGGMYEILRIIQGKYSHGWFTTKDIQQEANIGNSSVSGCISRLKKIGLVESRKWREVDTGIPRCLHRIVPEKRDFIHALYKKEDMVL